MAHFLYLRDGMANKNSAALELASRLQRAGHQITFASHRDISDAVTGHGFGFHHLTADQELLKRAQDDPMPSIAGGNIGALWRWLKRRRAIRKASFEQTEVEDLISRLKPDLVLIDLECHYFILAASASGVPVVLLAMWLSIFRRPGLPPLSSDLQPGDDWRSKLAISLSWLRLRAGAFKEALAMTYGRTALSSLVLPVLYDTKRRRDLEALARLRSFDWRANTDETQWLRPCIFANISTLMLTAQELEFPHTPPSNAYYAGPMIRPFGEDKDQASNAEWAKFSAYRAQGQNSARPLVYCSLGSFWAPDSEFLQKVISVFRKRRDWDLVIGLGGKEFSAQGLPDNILVMKWAPQREALSMADCAVTHGGLSTINECLAYRTPMIVYSTKKVDQNGNAARIAYHRLGIAADKDQDEADDIERKIETCLSSDEFKQNLATMAAALEKYKTDNVAVKIIETALKT